MRYMRGSSLLRRAFAATLTMVLGFSVVWAIPAYAGTFSSHDIVIDNFTSGSGLWSACGSSTFDYYQSPSIAGGARELEMRDGGSCIFGPYPAQMSINATQGTAEWFGNHTYSPEQVFAYGTEIGTYGPSWSPSPNKGKGVPLNLSLSLSDEIVVNMVEVQNPFLGIRLRDGNGNTYSSATSNLAAGDNFFPLSSFQGLTAADAANIDGISFEGSSNSTPGDIVSEFAIKPGDTTPPVAAPTQTPAANSYGWNNTDVTVNWNWTDSGSGINLNNCTQESTSSGQGAGITLTASCSDNAGNVATASYSVNVDKTPPVVTYLGNGGTYLVAQSVTISCDATDALSGVASDTCANVTGPAWSFGLGTHTFSATATDKAGNVGSGSTSFTVTVDYNSLCALVGEFASNNGIANSLCAKLDAAAAAAARGQSKVETNNLRAFDHEVAAQAGKALTSDQANLLTTFAAAL